MFFLTVPGFLSLCFAHGCPVPGCHCPRLKVIGSDPLCCQSREANLSDGVHADYRCLRCQTWDIRVDTAEIMIWTWYNALWPGMWNDMWCEYDMIVIWCWFDFDIFCYDYALLWSVALGDVMLCTFCYVMLCYVMLMLCSVMLCYVVLC